MTKKATGKLNAELEKALAAELAEVLSKHPTGHEKAGQFVYSITDRMRVYDRALKLEQVKLKIDDPEWGKEFR